MAKEEPINISEIKHLDVSRESLVENKIQELLALNGNDLNAIESSLIQQIIQTSLKIVKGNFDLGELKLMTRAFKEMHYAYCTFHRYPKKHRISIFGSARTSETHSDYQAAKKFSALMTKRGWVCITGAAEGIMRAGLEGAEKESSFGLSIRLPTESPMNSLLAGDPKLITFRYFFTRKLMFLSHSDAIAAFPGGVGTQDELFEVLTLMQTGKANLMPLVLLEGEKGAYWEAWIQYMKNHLLKNGWISEEDFNLFHFFSSVEEAVEHIQNFYKKYHSSRYIRDTLAIRVLSPLKQKELDLLNEKYHILIKDGKIEQREAFPEESDHLELPRLAFKHTRSHYGLLRKMIDEINNFD